MRKLPLVLNSLAAACCITMATHSAHAQMLSQTTDVPRTISYQGLLTSTNGIPVVDGDYNVTLSLYADPTGTIKVWQDSYTASVNGGVFNVYLGSGNALLPDATTMNRPLWVGIQLEDSAPMYPLTPLSSSPYALNVPDRAITTGKLADGSVTAEKVNMDYIAGIAVNGQPVTTKGSVLNIAGSDEIAVAYNAGTNTLQLSKPTPATRGDGEKGGEVLDATDGSENWKGRTNLTNPLVFLTPVGTYNTLAGGASNSIGSASDYSAIVGGQDNFIDENTEHAFIGGGDENTIQYEGDFSTITGGQSNLIEAEYQWSFIGGGDNNTIRGSYVAIGGGENNTAEAFHTVVGGGQQNTVSGHDATIAGGSNNRIWGNGTYGSIGGGQNHNIYNGMSTIAGGSGNTTGTAISGGYGATIGGGQDNSAIGDYSTIAGGQENTASDVHSIVGAGYMNTVAGITSIIGAGQGNEIQYDADYSAIVGGQSHLIEPESQWSFIGGGDNNQLQGNYVVISGGQNNISSAFHTAIGGGNQNTTAAHDATIAGGSNNNIGPNGTYGSIGGGQNHNLYNGMGTIAGGSGNTTGTAISGGYGATVGGGQANSAVNDYSTVAGGQENTASGAHSTVSGGQENTASGAHSTVSGGNQNTASGAYSTAGGGAYHIVSGDYATVSGGAGNNAAGDHATISGGELNTTGSYHHTTIGGGSDNTTTGSYATISGGELNSAGSYATIGGGDAHVASALNSTIAGGWDNTASGTFSTIGGGKQNTASVNSATIPGGDNLQANSYAQTVVGFYNATRTTGNFTSRPATGALNNNPLFIVGNGGTGTTANAFEVSYNGHTTVYGTNSAVPAGLSTIYGATYRDNILYAWGDIGIVAGPGVAVNSSFGVQNVVRMGAGIYQITISVTDPVTGLARILDDASIVATLVAEDPENFPCGTIAVTRLDGMNRFKVCTKNAACHAVDLPFMFHLTGRDR